MMLLPLSVYADDAICCRCLRRLHALRRHDAMPYTTSATTRRFSMMPRRGASFAVAVARRLRAYALRATIMFISFYDAQRLYLFCAIVDTLYATLMLRADAATIFTMPLLFIDTRHA